MNFWGGAQGNARGPVISETEERKVHATLQLISLPNSGFESVEPFKVTKSGTLKTYTQGRVGKEFWNKIYYLRSYKTLFSYDS